LDSKCLKKATRLRSSPLAEGAYSAPQTPQLDLRGFVAEKAREGRAEKRQLGEER